MAAPISVDHGEAGELGKGSNKSLAVSKSSSKIKKGLRPTLAHPRLAPTVYKTEPSDFRSLVQKLTGTSQPVATSPPSGLKPPNSRLQRIAPPPLRPAGTYPSYLSQSAGPQSQLGLVTNPSPSSGNQLFPFGKISSLSKHVASPFPVSPLSFSPLPQLSPSDQSWVNSLNGLESPGSAVIRQLAQNIAEGNVPSSKQDHPTGSAGSSPTVGASSLPSMSPTLSNIKFTSASFGLPSPSGFPSPSVFEFGLGNIYGMSGTFTPSAAQAMDAAFSFPEPDIAMSPASSP